VVRYCSSEAQAFGGGSSGRRLRGLWKSSGRRIIRSRRSVVPFRHILWHNICMFKELDTFSNESDVMWRGFVTSVIAAMSLQYVDPFGTAKLVLFQVTSISDKWRGFELVSPIV
jgi:hypothetical protein